MAKKKVKVKKKRPSKPSWSDVLTGFTSHPKRSSKMTQSVLPQSEKKQPLNDTNSGLVKAWHDRSMSAVDRANTIVFAVCEHGMDYIPAMAHLILDSDEAAKGQDLIKMLGQEPLITERYLGPAKVHGVGRLACAIAGTQYAWVTTKDSVTCLPCECVDLSVGDLVLIHPKAQKIVGKDGDLASVGSVATVDSIPEGTKGQVLVLTGQDNHVLAWLHHSLMDNPPAPGEKVIYDERHRFVLSRVNTETKGDELLAQHLPIVHRHMVGSPHPIAEQVVNHFRDAIEHPEWLAKLGSRDRKSYLFIGQTGGGKSYHIKLIATEIHDLIEEHTGTRHGRVVLCDSSQFWSPYFGDSEQKINAWAKKVSKLGSQKLYDKDGKELSVPILIVIEEAEALFRARGGDKNASGHLFDRVLSLLLQKLESIENALGVPVVWVCSTNRPDLIDAAAMRRIGMRKAIFGNLQPDAAHKVMLTKTADLNVDGDKIAEAVVHYLYENEQGQDLVSVSLHGQKDMVLQRKDIVTPSVLEEALSSAVDKCINRSRESKRLQKVSTEDIVEFLDTHFQHLARTLTPGNLPEYCPEWFQDGQHITGVKVCR